MTQEQREEQPPDLGRQVAERIMSLQKPRESDAAFARRVGLSPQLVNNYKHGRGGASLDIAATVASRTGRTLDWLVFGEGDETANPLRPVGGREMDELRGLLRDALEIIDPDSTP